MHPPIHRSRGLFLARSPSGSPQVPLIFMARVVETSVQLPFGLFSFEDFYPIQAFLRRNVPTIYLSVSKKIRPSILPVKQARRNSHRRITHALPPECPSPSNPPPRFRTPGHHVMSLGPPQQSSCYTPRKMPYQMGRSVIMMLQRILELCRIMP